MTELKAGDLATDRMSRERSAEGGQKSRANARAKTDGAVLTAARALLAARKAPPSRWNASGTIAEQLNHKPERKRVDSILAQLAGDPGNKLPDQWIPLKVASPRKK